MKRIKTINVDGHKCKLTLVKSVIQENDFVISKQYFEGMDKNGIYDSKVYKPVEVQVEKVILINIGTNNPEMVLGFPNGGFCDKALQAIYSIVEISLIK
jgi:hypothetical protein